MTREVAAAPVTDLLNLDGQRALVTGGSGNIGHGIAMRLAEAGADIIVHYVNDAEGAAATVDAAKAAGRDAVSMQADLTHSDEVAEMFGKIDESGAVNCVVNNAGGYPVQGFTEMSAQDWQQVMAANLDSAVYVSQEAIRRMCDAGSGGAIVNIASIEGSDPAVGHAHYATSKAGALMLTRSCALEYGHKGIRVNAVSPGLIERAGIEENWPDGVARWQEHAPLKRMGRTTDVADAVLFLLSAAARWISGVNLVVDGGMSTVSRW